MNQIAKISRRRMLIQLQELAIFALEFTVTKIDSLSTKNLRSMRLNNLDFHNFCPRMYRQRKSIRNESKWYFVDALSLQSN